MAKAKTSSPPKGRVLTAAELALAEGLSKALIGKATAEATLDVCRREIGRLTQEINKLGFHRAGLVWAEARAPIGGGQPPCRGSAGLSDVSSGS